MPRTCRVRSSCSTAARPREPTHRGGVTAPLPVVVGVGQVTHRDDEDLAPAEPIELLLAAARAAEYDAGVRLLDRIDEIELMPIGAWPYDDLPGLVVERLGLEATRVRAREHP